MTIHVIVRAGDVLIASGLFGWRRLVNTAFFA